MQKGDILLVSELSRLGRSLMEVMSILHSLMEKDVKVFTTKERYELGNNINSKVFPLYTLVVPAKVIHRLELLDSLRFEIHAGKVAVWSMT